MGGRPNVGKSTLFNQLLGPKLSIVSHRRQTTRYSIRGILTEADTQFVLIDTPGWQLHHGGALNRRLTAAAEQSIPYADAGVLVLEGQRLQADDERIAGLFPASVPVVAVLNKVDRLKQRDRMLPLAEQISAWRDFAAIIPASALNGEGMSVIKEELRKLLPEAEALYPAGVRSDRTDSFFIADFIRERIFHLLGDELPYRSAVEVRAIKRLRKDLLHIHADIIVDTESRKAMFIGARGQMLKRIGTTTRPLLEEFLSSKVYLELLVRVHRNWMCEPAVLARLGLGS